MQSNASPALCSSRPRDAYLSSAVVPPYPRMMPAVCPSPVAHDPQAANHAARRMRPMPSPDVSSSSSSSSDDDDDDDDAPHHPEAREKPLPVHADRTRASHGENAARI